VAANTFTDIVGNANTAIAKNILVKSACNTKQRRYISHVANIPIANVLVEGSQTSKCSACNVAITVAANTFTDIVGNANTAIAKNTTQIIYLEKQVDIDDLL
jgi:hypothetical protein